MAQFNEKIYALKPWYHDFSALGLQTQFDDKKRSAAENFGANVKILVEGLKQRTLGNKVEQRDILSLRRLFNKNPNSHRINQAHKENILLPLLKQALEMTSPGPTCLDLFCADGYYSCWMKKLAPAAEVTGIDLDARHLQRAQTALQVLGYESGTSFKMTDVWDFIASTTPYDLIFCAGGLYHLEEPQRFTEQLAHTNSRYLIVQSVVTLEREDEDYFVSPAPGWKHGSRFTHAALAHWLTEAGWEIIEEHRNTLTGNTRLLDRGSSYFLCRHS